MSSLKKTSKTDFIPGNLDDIVNASQFLNNSPKGKQKRRLHITNKNIPNLSALDASNAKKRKTNEDFEDCGESRQKILHVMNRQLQSRVEGLILRGAMKPDDRPLWFDVYKAFPPTVEPKFARTKPENIPIRPILYKEDNMRVKFQSKGHGIGTNLLSPSGETYTKRLINKYEQLKLEGVTEDELVEKSVAAVASERKTDNNSNTPKNPDSLASSILSDANIHNIFK